MFRLVRNLTILVAAFGIPYAASETDWGRSFVSRWGSAVPGAGDSLRDTLGGYPEDVEQVGYANHSHHEVEKLRDRKPSSYRYDSQTARRLGVELGQSQHPSLTGGRFNDVRQFMRFDISPDWVLSQFSRVSTVLADTSLEGMRVPVVTGTAPTDLAGTVTYSFDRQGQLQRLAFHGFTGDPSRLVATMTQDYGLEPTPSLEAGVYTKRWNGVPVHFLRLSFAPVVHSDALHQKYTVFMELNQPSLAYGISPEAKRIITSDRGTSRW